jgi:hypothetical protein
MAIALAGQSSGLQISVKNYMSYKPQNEKAEIAFQSGGKILTALTRFE